MKRKYGAACLLLAIMILVGALATGCSSSSSSVAGTYVSQAAKTNSLVLTSDGKFSLKEGSTDLGSGTYKVSNGKITLKLTSPSAAPEQSGTISGNTITEPSGIKWVKK